ncbi:alpha/beta-hydrolase [Astrocystis sublimbata]|nr:alpha/beta-hydrolase [Astrocystis sublimbata]
MTRPTFVLLHGAWHVPQCWNLLVSELHKAGYATETPALPSSGSVPPTPDWTGDIDTIRNTVSKLVVDQDVVVVMHSFSGMTGGTALDGLDKESCQSKGWKGGVVRLIYLVAFLVPEGFQHSPPGTRDNMVPEMKTDLEKGTVVVLPEDAKDMFYQDLDDETAADLAKDLRPHSFASYWGTTDHAAWRIIPTTYIVTLNDRPSTVDACRHLIDAAKASGHHKIDRVIEVEAGHSPFISKPEWTAKTLIEEAKRDGVSAGKGLAISLLST